MPEELSPVLSPHVDRLVQTVLQRACDRNLRLATAESCTGGLLASLLTDVEGCSHAFERGFVVYTDDAKHEMLGVRRHLLEEAGAVSEEVARAMAEGGLRFSHADICLSVTGFAGPGGPESTPGLVYFGIARRRRPTRVVEERFTDGSRSGVRLASIERGLELIDEALDDDEPI